MKPLNYHGQILSWLVAVGRRRRVNISEEFDVFNYLSCGPMGCNPFWGEEDIVLLSGHDLSLAASWTNCDFGEN